MVRKVTIALFAIFLSTVVLANDRITALPGLKKIPDREYAGYLKAGKKTALFYWFIASHKPNAPLIVWSNGGPGYSSIYGFFNETGPYHVNSNLTLTERVNGWNHFANYLIIDQPSDVGLSAIAQNTPPTTRRQSVDQYYDAVVSFFNAHPNYRHAPIFLAGESYAGTILPLVAEQIVKNQAQNPIRLHGLILVSPWIDPRLQQSMDSTYAYTHGLITKLEEEKLDAIDRHCNALINAKKEAEANKLCSSIDDVIQKKSRLELANIAYLHSQDNILLDRYMNQTAVLKAIHATPNVRFSCWSGRVNAALTDDIQRSVKPVYNTLLADHVPILIFSGLNDDKDTNFLGVQRVIHSLHWSGAEAFFADQTLPVIVNGKVLGYQRSGGGLTWIRVLNAGHMVPLDQPRVSKIVGQFVEKHR